MENIMKVSKKVIVFLMSLFVIVTSGISIHATNKKVQETRKLYYSVKLSDYDITTYNEKELTEFKELVDAREIAFDHKDIEQLAIFPQDFNELNQKVNDRIEKEKIDKIKKQVDEIKLPKTANEDEKKSFNKLKKEILEKYEDSSYTSVHAAKDKKQLEEEKKKIEKSIKQREEEQIRLGENRPFSDYNDSSNEYFEDDNTYYSDEYNDSSYVNSNGGYTPPAQNPAPQPSPPHQSEECWKEADGSETCSGGAW